MASGMLILKVTVNEYINKGTEKFRRLDEDSTAVHEIFMHGCMYKRSGYSCVIVREAGSSSNEFFIGLKNMYETYVGGHSNTLAYVQMVLSAETAEGSKVRLVPLVDYTVDYMYLQAEDCPGTFFYKKEDIMFDNTTGIGLKVEGKRLSEYLEQARNLCTTTLLFENGDSTLLDDTVIIEDSQYDTVRVTEIQLRDDIPSVVSSSFMSNILGLSGYSDMIIPYQDDSELECWKEVGIVEDKIVILNVRNYTRNHDFRDLRICS